MLQSCCVDEIGACADVRTVDVNANMHRRAARRKPNLADEAKQSRQQQAVQDRKDAAAFAQMGCLAPQEGQKGRCMCGCYWPV